MKKLKKVFNIIIIFILLQVVLFVFSKNNSYAEEEESFFDDVFHSGKQWSNMGTADADNIVENANGIFKATDDIYNVFRVIGGAMFIVAIGFTGVSLSMKNNGKDIAEMKVTIAFIVILAVLFICAEPIKNAFTDLFGLLEDTIE